MYIQANGRGGRETTLCIEQNNFLDKKCYVFFLNQSNAMI